MNKWRFFVGIVVLLFVVACDVVNPEEEIPAYLSINEFSFSTDFGQGSSSTKITEAWVYVGGEFLGAYSLPATVPVLASGDQEVWIYPGIKENGSFDTPNIYPFYKRYEQVVPLVAGETNTINPSTIYEENLTFSYLENFDNPHIFNVDLDSNAMTDIIITSADAFENASGIITLDAENYLLEIATGTAKPLVTNGTDVYLELNYKNDIDFQIGLIANHELVVVPPLVQSIYLFRPKEEWNKIYINLGPNLKELSDEGFVDFQLFIGALYQGESTVNIHVDNLKVVHFTL